MSIALTTCQGERFLQAQLDSLAAQTKLPCELVVCDDASTDATVAIIERFARRAPFPVHLHRNASRLGFRANFLQTANLCTGDLIAFCDQDDIWYETKLARCMVPFGDPEVMLVCHDADIVDAQAQKTGKRLARRKDGVWEANEEPLHHENGLVMVYRRCLNDHYDLWPDSTDENVLDDALSVTTHAAHDNWYYFLAIILGKVVTLDDALLGYRQHGSNLVGVQTPKIDKTPEFRGRFYRARAREVSIRIDLLKRLRPRAQPKYQARIDERFGIYARFVAISNSRAMIYGGVTLATRLAGITGMLKAGGYRASELGLRGLAPDLLFGIVRLTPGSRVASLYTRLRR